MDYKHWNRLSMIGKKEKKCAYFWHRHLIFIDCYDRRWVCHESFLQLSSWHPLSIPCLTNSLLKSSVFTCDLRVNCFIKQYKWHIYALYYVKVDYSMNGQLSFKIVNSCDFQNSCSNSTSTPSSTIAPLSVLLES